MQEALREYETVAWVDMDGYMPFAPRPRSRTCVPFTECWPAHLNMVFTQAGGAPPCPGAAAPLRRRAAHAARLAPSAGGPERRHLSAGGGPAPGALYPNTAFFILRRSADAAWCAAAQRPPATALEPLTAKDRG